MCVVYLLSFLLCYIICILYSHIYIYIVAAKLHENVASSQFFVSSAGFWALWSSSGEPAFKSLSPCHAVAVLQA